MRLSKPNRADPSADMLIEAGDWPGEEKLRSLVQRALAAAMAAACPPLTPATEISVVFTDDDHIRSLNQHYRRKDVATNVLSFPAARTNPNVFGPILGDLVLARETILREAAVDNLAPDDHLIHLIVHGFLHLIGYDHGNDDEAAVMENLETAILARLGIADPYQIG